MKTTRKLTSGVVNSEDSIPPDANLRVCSSRVLLQAMNQIQERKVGWDALDWEDLDVVRGPGEGASSEWLRIQSHYPWKEVFDAQRKGRGKNYCNVEIHGVDGYVPCHHIFLLNVSELLDTLIKERIESGKPPTPSKVLSITLEGVKVDQIREILSLLYTGSAQIEVETETEFKQAMRMLQIKKVKFEKLFPGSDQLPKKFRQVLVIRARDKEEEKETLEEDEGEQSREAPQSVAPAPPQPSTSRGLLEVLDEPLPPVQKVKPGADLLKKKKERIKRQPLIQDDDDDEEEKQQSPEDDDEEESEIDKRKKQKGGKYERDNAYVPPGRIHEKTSEEEVEDEEEEEDEVDVEEDEEEVEKTPESSSESEIEEVKETVKVTRSRAKAKSSKSSRKSVSPEESRYPRRKKNRSKSSGSSPHKKTPPKKPPPRRASLRGKSQEEEDDHNLNKSESEQEESPPSRRETRRQARLAGGVEDESPPKKIISSDSEEEENGGDAEGDVEASDEEECGVCHSKFESLKFLERHLKTKCGKSFQDYYDLGKKFCLGCQNSFRGYSNGEFINHVGTCVSSNHKKTRICRRRIEDDDDEEDKEVDVESQEEGGDSKASVEVVSLRKYEVQVDNLPDEIIAQLLCLVQDGKPVHLNRPAGFNYSFPEGHSKTVVETPASPEMKKRRKPGPRRRGKKGGAQKRKLGSSRQSSASSVVVEPPTKKVAAEEEQEKMEEDVVISPPAKKVAAEEEQEKMEEDVVISPPAKKVAAEEEQEKMEEDVVISPPAKKVAAEEEQEKMEEDMVIPSPAKKVAAGDEEEKMEEDMVMLPPAKKVAARDEEEKMVEDVVIPPPAEEDTEVEIDVEKCVEAAPDPEDEELPSPPPVRAPPRPPILFGPPIISKSEGQRLKESLKTRLGHVTKTPSTESPPPLPQTENKSRFIGPKSKRPGPKSKTEQEKIPTTLTALQAAPPMPATTFPQPPSAPEAPKEQETPKVVNETTPSSTATQKESVPAPEEPVVAQAPSLASPQEKSGENAVISENGVSSSSSPPSGGAVVPLRLPILPPVVIRNASAPPPIISINIRTPLTSVPVVPGVGARPPAPVSQSPPTFFARLPAPVSQSPPSFRPTLVRNPRHPNIAATIRPIATGAAPSQPRAAAGAVLETQRAPAPPMPPSQPGPRNPTPSPNVQVMTPRPAGAVPSLVVGSGISVAPIPQGQVYRGPAPRPQNISPLHQNQVVASSTMMVRPPPRSGVGAPIINMPRPSPQNQAAPPAPNQPRQVSTRQPVAQPPTPIAVPRQVSSVSTPQRNLTPPPTPPTSQHMFLGMETFNGSYYHVFKRPTNAPPHPDVAISYPLASQAAQAITSRLNNPPPPFAPTQQQPAPNAVTVRLPVTGIMNPLGATRAQMMMQQARQQQFRQERPPNPNPTPSGPPQQAVPPKNNSTQGRFTCPACNLAFETPAGLESHEEEGLC